MDGELYLYNSTNGILTSMPKFLAAKMYSSLGELQSVVPDFDRETAKETLRRVGLDRMALDNELERAQQKVNYEKSKIRRYVQSVCSEIKEAQAKGSGTKTTNTPTKQSNDEPER